MSLVGNAPDDRCGLRRDVPVDQEEGRPDPMVLQDIEERRRPIRVRAIVKREVDRWRRVRLRRDAPHGSRAMEQLEQKWKRRRERERCQSRNRKKQRDHAWILRVVVRAHRAAGITDASVGSRHRAGRSD